MDIEMTIFEISKYKWEFFRDIEDLRKQRRRAYKSFVEDYKQSSKGGV